MEDFVKRVDRTVLLVVFILLATLAPMTFAGVARFVRTQNEAELAREQQLVAEFGRQLEDAEWQRRLPADEANQQWRLLDGSEVTATLQALQTLVDASGVTLVAAKASPSSKGGRQLFLLSGSGRPEQVCQLAAGIERCPRLIVIESGRLAPRSDEVVDFEFGLATYHRGGAQ
ncbi:MAG: hypothetical protein JNM25_00765 [Planctomycetes bacterium]|nr:hypothetical protein [Planctomycetota bacterium]